MKGIVDGYSAMIRELDEKGIIDEIGQYMQSPASGYLSQIIKGDETAEEWIGKAGDLLNIDELLEEASGLNSIRSEFSDAIHDSDIGIDVDVADWEEILQTMSALESATESVTDASLATTAKFNTSHYCAYNFDCWIAPDGDASINGTEFKSIHENKQADAEYIITGLGAFPAVMKTEIMISHVLVLANVLKDYANETIRNTIYAIACVISEIIFAVSEGTVNIDPRIIAVGLTIYCAIVQAIKDLWSIVKGQRAVIFEYEGVNMVTFNYRDFLYLFSLCTPEEELLERSLEVLNRDYGTLYKGITLEADFRGNTYSLEKSYQIYE